MVPALTQQEQQQSSKLRGTRANQGRYSSPSLQGVRDKVHAMSYERSDLRLAHTWHRGEGTFELLWKEGGLQVVEGEGGKRCCRLWAGQEGQQRSCAQRCEWRRW